MKKVNNLFCLTLCVLILFFACGCHREIFPDEIKKISIENLDLLKQAAELTIDKNIKAPISYFKLNDDMELSKEDLSIYKKCQDIGIRDLHYSNGLLGDGSQSHSGKPYFVEFNYNFPSKAVGIIYIPDNSDFKTPEEVVSYANSIYEEGKKEEVLELDDNWYYYCYKW